MAMLAKFFVFISFDAVYVYAAELFPTVVRYDGSRLSVAMVISLSQVLYSIRYDRSCFCCCHGYKPIASAFWWKRQLLNLLIEAKSFYKTKFWG